MNQEKESLHSKTLKLEQGHGPEKSWMSGDETCKLLRISKRTLQNYRDKRVIPFSQIGRKIYYKYSDIVEYLEMHYVKPYYQKGGVA